MGLGRYQGGTVVVNESEEARPSELDHAIELVRAAFMEAMREYGIFLDTRIAIGAQAELNIFNALRSDTENE